jgi:hypothetical protein
MAGGWVWPGCMRARYATRAGCWCTCTGSRTASHTTVRVPLSRRTSPRETCVVRGPRWQRPTVIRRARRPPSVCAQAAWSASWRPARRRLA